MCRQLIIVIALVLTTEISPEVTLAQVDCKPLDPRDSVTTEREGTLRGSIDTFYKVAKAEGNLEAKVKDKIQNLPEGFPISEKNQIKLRTIYMFCEMIAKDKDLTPERKVALFNLMMGLREQDTTQSIPNTKKKSSQPPPKAPSSNSSSKTVSGNIIAEEKKTNGLEPAAVVSSDFSSYEVERLKLGSSFQFFTKNAPIHYRIWQKEAERGNAMAQVLAGRALLVGEGVSQDKAESIKWFERAADQGNVWGHFNLCNAYLFGLGVQIDRATALTYCEQAAKHNHSGAIRLLGEIYRSEDTGANSGAQKALKQYERASDLGDTGAMIAAAGIHIQGAPGVPSNAKQAMQLYHQAASVGNEEAKGILSAIEITEQLEQYASDSAQPKERELSLKSIKVAIQRVNDIEVTALITALGSFKVLPVISKLLTYDSSDPMRIILSDLLNYLAKRFRTSSLVTRAEFLQTLSLIIEPNVKNISDSERYVDFAHVCRDLYKGLDLTQRISGDQSPTVRVLRLCASSLFSAGYRDEATSLVGNASRMIQAILKERPWDWYVIDNSEGLYFDTGSSLHQLNDRERSQQYLSLAWNSSFTRFGRSDLIGRYTTLPIKGMQPPDVQEEDRAFFEGFAPGGKEKIRNDKYGITRFTLQADFDGTESPFHVYILGGTEGYKGLQDQFVWLKEYRGGKIPNAVQDSFRKLNKIAIDNAVDFRQLSVYAMGKEEEKSNPTSSK